MRHTDDCVAVCMPPRIAVPGKRRVCTKGCNKKLKVQKSTVTPNATSDADLFDIVVCQVNWRIICENGTCKTSKGVEPIARCSFSSEVWNSGPTCIANHIHNDKPLQCPEMSDQRRERIMSDAQCRIATQVSNTSVQNISASQLEELSEVTTGSGADLGACKKLADGLAEYY